MGVGQQWGGTDKGFLIFPWSLSSRRGCDYLLNSHQTTGGSNPASQTPFWWFLTKKRRGGVLGGFRFGTVTPWGHPWARGTLRPRDEVPAAHRARCCCFILQALLPPAGAMNSHHKLLSRPGFFLSQAVPDALSHHARVYPLWVHPVLGFRWDWGVSWEGKPADGATRERK